MIGSVGEWSLAIVLSQSPLPLVYSSSVQRRGLAHLDRSPHSDVFRIPSLQQQLAVEGHGLAHGQSGPAQGSEDSRWE